MAISPLLMQKLPVSAPLHARKDCYSKPLDFWI